VYGLFLKIFLLAFLLSIFNVNNGNNYRGIVIEQTRLLALLADIPLQIFDQMCCNHTWWHPTRYSKISDITLIDKSSKEWSCRLHIFPIRDSNSFDFYLWERFKTLIYDSSVVIAEISKSLHMTKCDTLWQFLNIFIHDVTYSLHNVSRYALM
jgi:hypothetical protein